MSPLAVDALVLALTALGLILLGVALERAFFHH